MGEFAYEDLLPIGPDTTPWRKLTDEGVGVVEGPGGRTFLQVEPEALRLLAETACAQFGGKYFCHDVRVARLPRHGASLPVAIAVSCSADRQCLGKITPDGVFIEQLEFETR